MQARTITIIGLQRLGASIGLAIKQSSLSVTLVGHDREMDVARQALKNGAIDEIQRNLSRAASLADILILSGPATEQLRTLEVVADVVQNHTLVLDLSGGGAAGQRAAASFKQGHYIPARLVMAAEMLMDGRTDAEAASPDLFRNSVFCIMPSRKIEPEAVETAINFGQLLGATPFFLDAAEYDGLVQGLETVPGLLAAALFKAVHGSAGWRDMLRFADLTFAQSTQPLEKGSDIATLAFDNPEATLRWLDALLSELVNVRRSIAEGERELLTAHIEELSDRRAAWLRDRTENNWSEIRTANVEGPSFTQQMLGGLAPGRDKRRKPD